MAKLSLNLDERTIKNGMAQVRLRINHKGTSAFVGTDVYVEPAYFIAGSLYDPIHRKAPMAVEKRDKIASIVRKFDELLLDIDPNELATLTAKDIKERACTGVRTRAQERPVKHRGYELDFLNWLDEYGRGRQAERTRKSYEYAWNVLREYCAARNMRDILFYDIDYARLSDFAQWMRESGRGEATRHMLESYIRAAYKEAEKRHIISRENDPYYDYSIKPVPKKDIDCLTVEQMHTLMTAEIPTSGMAKARDIAMMSFYLCGANLLDMYGLGKEVDGEAVFVRHKIEWRDQRPTHIRIEPELAKLLKIYGGQDSLFRFKEAYSTYETFQRRVTRQLKGVSKLVGFDVNMAKVRRTWPTIAGELEVPEYIIEKSMGHVDKTVTQVHYKKYDWGLTAKANRKVINAIKNFKTL